MDRAEKKQIEIAVIGGKLQGVEICYLAKKAGYRIWLIDRNPNALAKNLADYFLAEDVMKNKEKIKEILSKVDAVFPAMEEVEVLDYLEILCNEAGTTFFYDATAYRISSSKNRSKELFALTGIRQAKSYPECGFPLILKPDNLSGSHGVKYIHTQSELEKAMEKQKGEVVLEAYIEGRSFSLEVIGSGTQDGFSMITEIITDQDFDCKRVIAPAHISQVESEKMYEIGSKLANRLQIKGIFDIETIHQKEEPYVLEIDARFPSQTPVCIYHASGLNLVKALVEQDFSGRYLWNRTAIYQQISVTKDCITTKGERIMAKCEPLQLKEDFFGAQAALTDYAPEKINWNAILITEGASYEEAMKQFYQCMEKIETIIGKRKFIEG